MKFRAIILILIVNMLLFLLSSCASSPFPKKEYLTNSMAGKSVKDEQYIEFVAILEPILFKNEYGENMIEFRLFAPSYPQYGGIKIAERLRKYFAKYTILCNPQKTVWLKIKGRLIVSKSNKQINPNTFPYYTLIAAQLVDGYITEKHEFPARKEVKYK
ncbi:hypothetical protein AAEX28_05715 [Lentisphaerota bacterium WC36G]|nr:hypothetical protein LJT99_08575 [Lentisphaerae bacterium WC36]